VFRILFVALVAVLCVATSCGSNNTTQLDVPARGVSAVNATAAWNSVCAQYKFIPKPLVAGPITFLQGYHGTDFATDFAGIKAAVNGIMNVQLPTTGSDVMNVQLPTTGSDVMNVQLPTTGSDVMSVKIEAWTGL
jgi:hypothetical protein